MKHINLEKVCHHDVYFYADYLASIFRVNKGNGNYCIGEWIEINAHELKDKVEQLGYEETGVTHSIIRNGYIQLLIHKINNHSYGSGSICEIYEQRKQDTIKDVFCHFLTNDEVELIKRQCDYFEEIESFTDSCYNCCTALNALQYKQSMATEGIACCIDCLEY